MHPQYKTEYKSINITCTTLCGDTSALFFQNVAFAYLAGFHSNNFHAGLHEAKDL